LTYGKIVHKSTSGNGSTRVRIINRGGRKSVKVRHIGTAHNKKELNVMENQI
jgi:hypothetical protein